MGLVASNHFEVRIVLRFVKRTLLEHVIHLNRCQGYYTLKFALLHFKIV